VRGTSLAVHFLDLDRFKQVNDAFGHDGGDFLLKAVAERLRAASRISYHFQSGLNRRVYGKLVPNLWGVNVITCDCLIRGNRWSKAPNVRFVS
jgi:predicted signal transduction protein with EAL and GGDEF domain